MTRRNIALAIFIAAGSVAGATYLLNAQYTYGSAYPAYSSLRSDPLGAKLLFDSLALMPGESAARNYLPLEYLNGSGAAVLLLNLNPESLAGEQLKSLDALAARGNRVVAAMSEFSKTPDNSGSLAKEWKVRLGFDPDAPAGLRLYFTESAGWKPIFHEGAKILAIERTTDKGSEVLFADSSAFANAALVGQSDAADSFRRIATALGSCTRVIFDEEHLGIAQSGSVVGLVRRFRLTGMALGLAICAALFIWRNSTSFPPPESAGQTANAFSGRTSRSGLLTLLRRHVPAAELASVCWNEWLAANRRVLAADAASRAAYIARGAVDPAKALREIQSIVNSKGTL